MNSLILRTAIRYMMPLLLLFSLFILIRGHNEPGGGFTGGLVAASAFALYALGADVAVVRSALRVDPHVMVGAGLALALASGILAPLAGRPFLTSAWIKWSTALFGDVEIGTPLVFDIGVYLVVLGVTMLIVLSLAEE